MPMRNIYILPEAEVDRLMHLSQPEVIEELEVLLNILSALVHRRVYGTEKGKICNVWEEDYDLREAIPNLDEIYKKYFE